MIEKYNGAYVAIPLPSDMYLSWTWQVVKLYERARFPEIKRDDEPHTTIYYLGNIDDKQLQSAKRLVSKVAPRILGSELRVIGLQIIGSRERQALVLGIENTDQLRDLRRSLEKELPEYKELNLAFKPHLTITELRTRRSVERAREMVLESLPKRNQSDPLRIDALDVYYKK